MQLLYTNRWDGRVRWGKGKGRTYRWTIGFSRHAPSGKPVGIRIRTPWYGRYWTLMPLLHYQAGMRLRWVMPEATRVVHEAETVAMFAAAEGKASR